MLSRKPKVHLQRGKKKKKKPWILLKKKAKWFSNHNHIGLKDFSTQEDAPFEN